MQMEIKADEFYEENIILMRRVYVWHRLEMFKRSPCVEGIWSNSLGGVEGRSFGLAMQQL